MSHKVYRIATLAEKDCKQYKVGDTIFGKNFSLSNFSNDTRKRAECILEEVRTKRFPNFFHRSNVFVFPNDLNNERLYRWFAKDVPKPDQQNYFYLLEIETNDVEWHNVSFYETVANSFVKADEDKIPISIMKDAVRYWSYQADLDDYDTEGLINHGVIINITPFEGHHNGTIEMNKVYTQPKTSKSIDELWEDEEL